MRQKKYKMILKHFALRKYSSISKFIGNRARMIQVRITSVLLKPKARKRSLMRIST